MYLFLKSMYFSLSADTLLRHVLSHFADIFTHTMGALLEKQTRQSENLVQAAEEGNAEWLSQLIKAGANVNKADKFGNLAAHKAAAKGHRKCLRLLMKAGTNVNKSDKMERTPITQAAMYGNGDCVQLLIESGADVNSALLTVASSGHSVPINLLIQAGADVNCQHSLGNTPLILAAHKNDAKSLDVLVKAGADVNYRNIHRFRTSKGHSALEVVVEDCLGNYLLDEKRRCVQLLLKAGAHVNTGSVPPLLNWQWFWDSPPDHLAELLVIPRLLLAAGDTSNRDFLNSRDPVSKERENLRLTLKHTCRETIRNHLMELNPINLFVKVPRLGLPQSLAQYLLYNESVNKD